MDERQSGCAERDRSHPERIPSKRQRVSTNPQRTPSFRQRSRRQLSEPLASGIEHLSPRIGRPRAFTVHQVALSGFRAAFSASLATRSERRGPRSDPDLRSPPALRPAPRRILELPNSNGPAALTRVATHLDPRADGCSPSTPHPSGVPAGSRTTRPDLEGGST